MNKKGFKWKTLQNDPASGVRFQIMQMNRPADIPRSSNIQSGEPLVLKGVHLYLLSSEESYIDESFEQLYSDANDSMAKTGNKLPLVEIPLCFYAGLRHIQAEKQVT